jgi:hypothetical protein
MERKGNSDDVVKIVLWIIVFVLAFYVEEEIVNGKSSRVLMIDLTLFGVGFLIGKLM